MSCEAYVIICHTCFAVKVNIEMYWMVGTESCQKMPLNLFFFHFKMRLNWNFLNIFKTGSKAVVRLSACNMQSIHISSDHWLPRGLAPSFPPVFLPSLASFSPSLSLHPSLCLPHRGWFMSAALGRVGWRGRDTAADGEWRKEGRGGEEKKRVWGWRNE